MRNTPPKRIRRTPGPRFTFKSVSSSMQGLCKRFTDDRRGAIAIIFGFMLTIVVTMVGGSVDYARWLAAKGETVAAMDAAVLAGGRALQLGKSPAEALAIAQSYYDQNKSPRLTKDRVTFTVEAGGTEVLAVSNSAVKTPVLSVTGVGELGVIATARSVVAAGANSGTNIEISLMLDTTGSMGWSSSSGGSKMSHLKAAAKDLVDIVIWNDQSEFKSRVALAPFAQYVNVSSTYAQKITNNSSRNCVKERTTNKRYKDAKPNSDNGYFTYKSSTSCGRPVVPLSSDKVSLKSAIDALPTSGGTAGHLGTAWSWYLLSPKWSSIWPQSAKPMGYSKLTVLNDDGQPILRKIAVLMTDGEFNTEYSGDSSTTQARAICTKMKNAGIEVYSVGFEIRVGGEADTTMSQCASSSSHYYNASSGDALRQVFRDIALKISTLRLKE
jgi:Flp pilus assembly protein TadG